MNVKKPNSPPKKNRAQKVRYQQRLLNHDYNTMAITKKEAKAQHFRKLTYPYLPVQFWMLDRVVISLNVGHIEWKVIHETSTNGRKAPDAVSLWRK